MAEPFFDLSLLPSSSGASPLAAAAAAARALDLGYSAVALDHPHRGLLADSDRCRASLPPPSTTSHRLRHGPFRHYTRITLSLDSAAAAASALAPSAARLLRTYDIVAARPLTQAAFDHLCQFQPTAELDLISIDFSRKLPFRIKLPMLRLALQRGLYFEIAYTPLISDANSRRQVLAEAKLLVDWTKGKNVIISSAAHTANQIRGPYDVINLCAYLLGLSAQRAKAAVSLNCRSLVSRALRKKHFYKETIRIDRLLPNEQLNPAKSMLGDWIGWDPVSCNGDVHPLKTNLEPSANKDDLLGSSINSDANKVLHEKPHNGDVSFFADQPEQPTDEKEISSEAEEGTVEVNRDKVIMNCRLSTLPGSFSHHSVPGDISLDNSGHQLHEKPHNGDVSFFADQPEQPTDEKEISSEAEEGTVQVNRDKVIMNCRLSTLPGSFSHHNVPGDISLDNSGNNGVVMAHVQAASSVDMKSINEKVEFVQDAMEVDDTESCKLDLITCGSDHHAPLSSDAKLACFTLPQSIELSNMSLDDKGADVSNNTQHYAKDDIKHDSECTFVEKEDQAPFEHKNISCSDVCLKDKDPIHSNDISVDIDGHRDSAETLEGPISARADEAPFDLAVHLSSDLRTDIILPQQVMEVERKHNLDEKIEHIMRDKVDCIDRKTSTIISMEHALHAQATGTVFSIYDNKGSSDATLENDELKIQPSYKTYASSEEDIAKIHGQSLNYPYAGGNVEISAIRSEKRRQKLSLHRLSYLPFLGFLKSVPFKKKAFKVAMKRKS